MCVCIYCHIVKTILFSDNTKIFLFGGHSSKFQPRQRYSSQLLHHSTILSSLLEKSTLCMNIAVLWIQLRRKRDETIIMHRLVQVSCFFRLFDKIPLPWILMLGDDDTLKRRAATARGTVPRCADHHQNSKKEKKIKMLCPCNQLWM